MLRIAVFFLMCTGLVAGQSYTQHEYKLVDNMRLIEPIFNVIRINVPDKITLKTFKLLCDALEESCVGFVKTNKNAGAFFVINPTIYIPSLIPFFNDKFNALQATTKYEFAFSTALFLLFDDQVELESYFLKIIIKISDEVSIEAGDNNFYGSPYHPSFVDDDRFFFNTEQFTGRRSNDDPRDSRFGVYRRVQPWDKDTFQYVFNGRCISGTAETLHYAVYNGPDACKDRCLGLPQCIGYNECTIGKTKQCQLIGDFPVRDLLTQIYPTNTGKCCNGEKTHRPCCSVNATATDLTHARTCQCFRRVPSVTTPTTAPPAVFTTQPSTPCAKSPTHCSCKSPPTCKQR